MKIAYFKFFYIAQSAWLAQGVWINRIESYFADQSSPQIIGFKVVLILSKWFFILLNQIKLLGPDMCVFFNPLVI